MIQLMIICKVNSKFSEYKLFCTTETIFLLITLMVRIELQQARIKSCTMHCILLFGKY